jgi:peptidoglycan hydrolase-like protein with peptidoglycan-binding domain
MFVSSKFLAFAILVLAGTVDPGALPATAESLPPFRMAQSQAVSPPPDANVQKIQEALVWTGYYEGPIDGSAGPGTQSAAKKFQRELSKPETGTLDDSQAAVLAQRAQTAMQASGYRSILDPRSGVRIGIPFLLASQKKNANAGTDYISPDGRIQIGLRVFRTNQEFSAVFTQLKEKSATSSQLSYSTSRNNWFVLAGESATKKYYVRYHANRDLIAGFFSIHDKSLPKETNGPLVSAITIMSLTMQPFSADLNASSVASLSAANLFEPISLAVGDSGLDKDDQAGIPAPAAAPAPRAAASPAAVPLANAPRDDAALQALQKKIAEMESTQRKLQQQLAAKDAEKKADPPPAPKSWTPSYEMLGLLVGLVFLLVLLLGRRATGSKTAEPSRTAAPASEPSPAANAPPPQPVVVMHEAPVVTHEAPAVVPPPLPPPQPAAAAASGRGGFAVIVAMGGLVAVVLVIAFLVEKISSVTGF